MSFTDPNADYLVDRRRLRRKLSFWRIGAFAALAIAIVAIGWRLSGRGAGAFQHQIARVSIEGVITGDRDTLKLIDEVGRSRAVTAVILSIESPGGTTTGAERLYSGIRRLAAKKPVVAVVRGMAASGAYIAALGADRIVAQETSLVGSIGVLFQFPNVSRLLDTVGVKMEEIKSSPLKAAPNGLEPTSPEARAAMAAIVADSFDWFRNLVKDRRGLDDAGLTNVADGRVFTGRQGLGLKLVDSLGEERDAVEWLESERNVAKDLPVRDWKKDRSLERLGILGVSARFVEFLGYPAVSALFGQLMSESESHLLDGLVSVWQGGVVK